MIEDLKETAACGMIIHYSVDTTTDMVTYNDINGRVVKSNNCSGCSWRAICKPSTLPEIKHYFFTFGSDERYPYQGGYVEIAAPSIQAACTIFRAYYPDRVDGILNCSDYYTAAEFEKTGMKETGNRGAGCHCIIGPQSRKEEHK